MAQVKEYTVYKFNELSDEAKEKARNWLREGNDFSYHAESVIDDAKAIGALMGIDISKVYYTGFCSQGDGACFEGHYSYKKRSVKAVMEYAPLDTELHQLVKALHLLQKRNFYRLNARVKHNSGRYYHENCTDIDVENTNCCGGYPSSANGEEEALKQLLREFMQWIYKQLEREYDYQTSNEVIDENIIANVYDFTEDGSIY